MFFSIWRRHRHHFWPCRKQNCRGRSLKMLCQQPIYFCWEVNSCCKQNVIQLADYLYTTIIQDFSGALLTQNWNNAVHINPLLKISLYHFLPPHNGIEEILAFFFYHFLALEVKFIVVLVLLLKRFSCYVKKLIWNILFCMNLFFLLFIGGLRCSRLQWVLPGMFLNFYFQAVPLFFINICPC